MSTEGKNILCTNREIMHLRQVNKIEQYLLMLYYNNTYLDFIRWYTIANTGFFTFDLDLGVMVTQNVAEYPLHHMTHGPGKFELAMSNG